jgi:spermidine/putrescine transport system permease protein
VSGWSPALLGLALALFLVPTLIVLALAFKPPDPFGGVGPGWTTANLAGIALPQYAAIVWRTLWLSLLTTALCLLLATPAGYAIARAEPKTRARLLLLVIVPFWTSLIRIFAWKVLLHPEGAQGALSASPRLEQAPLLYTPAPCSWSWSTFLPLRSSHLRGGRSSTSGYWRPRDLGAGQLRAFVEIFLPGIQSGLLTAFLVVFIPALGSYVIPDLVGGPGGEMLGNKIAQRVFVDRNLPHASALSALLIGAVLLPMGAVLAAVKKRHAERHRRTREAQPLPARVTWLLLAFFYLPIAVVVVNSFNGARAWRLRAIRLVPPPVEHREIWPAVVNAW